MTLQLVRPEQLEQGQFESEISFAQRRDRVAGQMRAYLESMPADTRKRLEAERRSLADLEQRVADARTRAAALQSQLVASKVNGAADAKVAELEQAWSAARREAAELEAPRDLQAEVVTAFEQRYLADRHAAEAAELEGTIATARADYAQRYEALEPALQTLVATLEGLRECAEREHAAAYRRARLEAVDADRARFRALPVPPARVFTKEPGDLLIELRPRFDKPRA